MKKEDIKNILYTYISFESIIIKKKLLLKILINLNYSS